MIEERAQVIAIDKDSVWVEAKRESACSRCAAGKGCGTAVFQKLFGNKRSVLPVVNANETDPISVNVGDEVVIGVEENAIVKNSFTVYAAPIVTIILFAAVGETFLKEAMSINKDLASISGALIGLVFSIVGLRWYNRVASSKAFNRPVLLRRADSSMYQSEIKMLG